MKIAPSILSADFTRLGEQVQAVEAAGVVDRVQIDVMDGRFVPNITFGTLAVECLRPLTRLTLEVHLMVQPPEDFIEKFGRAGADTLIVHQESTPHLHRAIQQIHALGKKAGVALNPSTPAQEQPHECTLSVHAGQLAVGGLGQPATGAGDDGKPRLWRAGVHS